MSPMELLKALEERYVPIARYGWEGGLTRAKLGGVVKR